MSNFMGPEDWRQASQMAVEGRLRHLEQMHVIVLKPDPIPYGIHVNFHAASKCMLKIFTHAPQMVDHENCSLRYV